MMFYSNTSAYYTTKILFIFSCLGLFSKVATSLWISWFILWTNFTLFIFAKKIYNNLSEYFFFLLFIPSLWIYPSGFSKEAVCFILISLIILSINFISNKFIKFLIIFFASYFLIKIRILWLIILLFCYYLYFLYNSLWIRKITFGCIILVFLSLFIFKDNYYNLYLNLFDSISGQQNELIFKTKNTHFFTYHLDSTHFIDFLYCLFNALFTSLLRPFIWEQMPLAFYGYAFENLYIHLILFLSAFISIKYKIFPNNFHWILFVFGLIILSFIALATPNFGTLIRYRIIAFPFILFPSIFILNSFFNQKFPNFSPQINSLK